MPLYISFIMLLSYTVSLSRIPSRCFFAVPVFFSMYLGSDCFYGMSSLLMSTIKPSLILQSLARDLKILHITSLLPSISNNHRH